MKLFSRSAFFIAPLFFIGAYIRYVNLETHFAHADDIGVARVILGAKAKQSDPAAFQREINDRGSPLYASARYRLARGLGDSLVAASILSMLNVADCIPRIFTYAPAQFYLTAFLIQPDQPYRKLLYWGRFPAFLSSLLCMIALLLLCQNLHVEHVFTRQLLSTALFAFSWENIIYSTHMASYAIGCLGATLLMLLFLQVLEWKDLSLRRIAWMSGALAFLGHCQYQMLFFLPAFYLSALLFHYRREFSFRHSFPRFLLSGIMTGVLVAPMFFIYLRKLTDRGTNWNIGPNHEFLFLLPSGVGVLQRAVYSLKFFIFNGFLSLQSAIAFVPEESRLFWPLAIVLAFSGFFGFLGFLFSEDRKKRYVALFLLVTSLVWTALILSHKLTLSPTRHSLILLPLTILAVVEGFAWVCKKLQMARTRIELFPYASPLLTLGLAACFASWYPAVMSRRLDPFDPQAIREQLRQYGVKDLVGYHWTWNPALMEKDLVGTRIHLMDYDWEEEILKRADWPEFQRFAMVSHRSPLSPAFLSKYDVLSRKEVSSSVEIEFLPRTRNGANSYYFYVLRAKT